VGINNINFVIGRGDVDRKAVKVGVQRVTVVATELMVASKRIIILYRIDVDECWSICYVAVNVLEMTGLKAGQCDHGE